MLRYMKILNIITQGLSICNIKHNSFKFKNGLVILNFQAILTYIECYAILSYTKH